MSRMIFEVKVRVQGVKKRCRNVDNHSFVIEEMDFKTLSEQDVKLYLEKAKNVLKEKMKQSNVAILYFTRMQVGDMLRQTQFPDPEHKQFEIELDENNG